ncbi:MAG TPA: hypothetical protein VF980_00815 [Thermoanaerobaculia bacterium]
MTISVRKTSLWKREVDNKPGVLADTLQPLADTDCDLEIVMGYGMGKTAFIEVAPIGGKRATAAAEKAGLTPSPVPAVIVTGDNRAGLGNTFARAIGDAGINLNFLVAHVVGNRFSSVFGFDNEADCDRAIPLIRNAANAKKAKTATARQPVARA